ncbi:MAG: YggS family pyridoxal phosphate-dependent enzyme [Phycisphaerae bacterium]
MPVTKARIERNLQRIREDIAGACRRVGRTPRDVSIVAVTKLVDMETVKNLLDAGLTELGENRAQQLTERAAETGAYVRRRRSPLPSPVRWHMIGHLQRNKVRSVLECTEVIHSVDSLRLAEEIHNRAERLGRIVDVFLQVNCSQEEQKFGVAVGAAVHLAELICTLGNVRLNGLMTMAPLADDPERARPSFVRLRELFEEIRGERIGGEHFRHLSMGMSQDYAVAVEEGATILRIGTALFE